MLKIMAECRKEIIGRSVSSPLIYVSADSFMIFLAFLPSFRLSAFPRHHSFLWFVRVSVCLLVCLFLFLSVEVLV